MTAFEPRAALRAALERTHKNLVNDLNATPDDKIRSGAGGVSRSAIDVVVECGSLNAWVAAMLTGGETPNRSPEERAAFIASFQTKESTLAYLDQQTHLLLTAVDAMDENTLGDIVETPIGPMTRFGVVELTAMHMMYHDGQINYIQAMNGDAEMHW